MAWRDVSGVAERVAGDGPADAIVVGPDNNDKARSKLAEIAATDALPEGFVVVSNADFKHTIYAFRVQSHVLIREQSGQRMPLPESNAWPSS